MQTVDLRIRDISVSLMPTAAPVGAGSFGIVMRGTMSDGRIPVAVKAQFMDLRRTATFENEARVTNHVTKIRDQIRATPGLVTMVGFDAYRPDDLPPPLLGALESWMSATEAQWNDPNAVVAFLVLSWADGGNMRKLSTPRLNRLLGAPRPGEAHDVSESFVLPLHLAHAVAALHRYGVIHGDIKPANIVLESIAGDEAADSLIYSIGRHETAVVRLARSAFRDVGVPRLADYGLATIRMDEAGGGAVGDEDGVWDVESRPISGTVFYWSPELLHMAMLGKRTGTLSTTDDVWALGRTLASFYLQSFDRIIIDYEETTYGDASDDDFLSLYLMVARLLSGDDDVLRASMSDVDPNGISAALRSTNDAYIPFFGYMTGALAADGFPIESTDLAEVRDRGLVRYMMARRNLDPGLTEVVASMLSWSELDRRPAAADVVRSLVVRLRRLEKQRPSLAAPPVVKAYPNARLYSVGRRDRADAALLDALFGGSK